MISPWQRCDVTKIVVHLSAFIPVKRNWLKTFWISGRRRFLFLKEKKTLVWRTTSTSLKRLLWFSWLKSTITIHGGLLQSFSCYAFKSSKFAYSALSYMCMLSKLCKKKKEPHDFMILFPSVCTVTRQKKLCDTMIQQHWKIVYHSFNTFFSLIIYIALGLWRCSQNHL